MSRNHKRVFIDTNIFIRYLTGDDEEKAIKCKEIILYAGEKGIELICTKLIIAEIVYVLESDKIYSLSKEDISKKVSLILRNKSLTVPDKNGLLKALELYSELNMDFQDAYTIIEMNSQDVDEIYTYDRKHFKRAENIKILEP